MADALDRGAVVQAVTRVAPEAVIHQLTALAGVKSFKNFDKEFAVSNRLRTEGVTGAQPGVADGLRTVLVFEQHQPALSSQKLDELAPLQGDVLMRSR